jgi:glutaminyl-tRNA synthetase
LYDHLFTAENPDDVEGDADWMSNINPNSLEVLKACPIEPNLAAAAPGNRYQFERLGYFCVDAVESADSRPVFNRTVTLRDAWANVERALKKG